MKKRKNRKLKIGNREVGNKKKLGIEDFYNDIIYLRDVGIVL